MAQKKKGGRNGSGDDPPTDLDAIEAAIRVAATGRQGSGYVLGTLWAKIIDGALWKKRAKSPAAYLVATFPNLGLDVVTLSKFSAVARKFTADDENTAGMDSLFRLIAYGRAKGIYELNPPGNVPIELIKGGTLVTKKFSECTENEMKLALKHAEGKDVPPPPLTPDAVKKVAAIHTELTGLTRTPIKVSGEVIDGELGLTFTTVMISDLTVFAASMARLDLSAATPKRRPVAKKPVRKSPRRRR